MKRISGHWNFWRGKRLALLGDDIFLTIFSYCLAYFLRFSFSIPEKYFLLIFKCLPFLVFFRIASFVLFGLYSGIPRYASLNDLLSIMKAVTLGTLLFVFSTGIVFRLEGIPRSVFFIDWFIILILLGGARLICRVLREVPLMRPRPKITQKVLIIGAGDLGEILLRSIKRERDIAYEVVGFLDDDPDKIGRRIHGIKILGPIVILESVVKAKGVKTVIIAILDIPGTKIKEIMNLCRNAGVPCKIVPGVGTLLREPMLMNYIRPVGVEDLLKREPIHLNTEMAERFISGKIIMATGAGGSIGSELCRQIMMLDPGKLILFERGENNLYEITLDLKQRFPKATVVIPIIGDVSEVTVVDQVLKEHSPQIIFHAAAYKHVPMMESHPCEAAKNNILGTWNLASKSCEKGVEEFVLISTDKAIKPTSVMGATKGVAEMICRGFNSEGTTRFTTVRFGNVLESNGSVVPYFRRQIACGGPVTITHPEVTRYFMTISEAAQLVLQAAAMGKGGETYLLDMAEPIKILDLARDMISLSGLIPGEDIEIKFIGLRPGEKLHEELIAAKEMLTTTAHPKIFEVNGNSMGWNALKADIEYLLAEVTDRNQGAILQMLQEIVPDYHPDTRQCNRAIYE